MPNAFILCALAHDQLPRQVEGKMLTASPVVGAPLEKQHIGIFLLFEHTSNWSPVAVEIEKGVTAAQEVKAPPVQPLAPQYCLEFLARILWLEHRSAPTFVPHDG